jgi:hypothetical protein
MSLCHGSRELDRPHLFETRTGHRRHDWRGARAAPLLPLGTPPELMGRTTGSVPTGRPRRSVTFVQHCRFPRHVFDSPKYQDSGQPFSPWEQASVSERFAIVPDSVTARHA